MQLCSAINHGKVFPKIEWLVFRSLYPFIHPHLNSHSVHSKCEVVHSTGSYDFYLFLFFPSKVVRDNLFHACADDNLTCLIECAWKSIVYFKDTQGNVRKGHLKKMFERDAMNAMPGTFQTANRRSPTRWKIGDSNALLEIGWSHDTSVCGNLWDTWIGAKTSEEKQEISVPFFSWKRSLLILIGIPRLQRLCFGHRSEQTICLPGDRWRMPLKTIFWKPLKWNLFKISVWNFDLITQPLAL